MHGLEHRCRPAIGIDCAIDPCIAMIADDNPVVGIIAALDFADYVPDGAALIVLLRYQMHANAAGSKVVAEGKRALPALRHTWALEGLQDGRGVVIAEGNGDDVRLVT